MRTGSARRAGNFRAGAERTTGMKRLTALAVVAALLAPLPAAAYDPARDQALVRVLSGRIDGDVSQGLVPSDRAALFRAELDAAQRAIANNDSQASAMLDDIDREISLLDRTLDMADANHDLLFHVGDQITIAMRDGRTWRVDAVTDRNVFDLTRMGVAYPTGVQGVYLAKSSGSVVVTLADADNGQKVRFRLTFVPRVEGGG